MCVRDVDTYELATWKVLHHSVRVRIKLSGGAESAATPASMQIISLQR